MSFFTRGFRRVRESVDPGRVPPGQYLERGFPVLTAGPTPRINLSTWKFSLDYFNENLFSWSWDEFTSLPKAKVDTDIHCVTTWSKLDTHWGGVSIDTLFEAADITKPPAPFVMAYCYGGYTTNLPIADIIDGKAMVAYEYDSLPLDSRHGGPARLFVPHLYLWKSAKWVQGLRFMDKDSPGFWESYGYHMYGDPWKEQRYHND